MFFDGANLMTAIDRRSLLGAVAVARLIFGVQSW
jgi:hypothetical protein